MAKVIAWCGGSPASTSPSSQTLHPHVPAPTARAAAPAPHSQSFVLLSERWERMGTDVLWKGRVQGELPMKWPEVLLRWSFLHSGKPVEPLFSSTIKYNQGKQRELGREWESARGLRTSPTEPLWPSRACPLHVPLSPPGQTARHSALQPPPAPAANTARIFPLGGGHRSSFSLVLIQSS